jgi:hypothetical protein
MYPIDLRGKYGIRFRSADPGGGGGAGGAAAPPAGGQPPAGGGAAIPFGLSQDHVAVLQSKGWFNNGNVDVGKLVDGYVNVEKAIGADKLVLPPKGADGSRDWTKWDGWTQLGRPEKPEAYQVKVPDGYQLTDTDKAFHQAILPLAHQAGLSQSQLDILAEGFNGFSGQLRGNSEAAVAREVEAAESALRQKFGAAFDVKLDIANRAMEHFFGKELIAAVDKAGLGRNAAFVEKMAALGELMAEDNKLPGGGKPSGGALDPAAAQKEIAAMESAALAAMQKGESHPGHDKTHPEYAAWQEKRRGLYAMADPAGGKAS